MFHRIGDCNCDCVELCLSSRGAVLHIELKSRSLCGMHLVGRIWMRHESATNWREVEPQSH